MNPLPDRLNDALERQGIASSSEGWEPRQRATNDPEVEGLVQLASHLQVAPPLQADPTFARHLEQRLLARNAALQRSRPASSRWGWHVPRLVRAHPLLGVALSLVLVVMLLGTGVLVVAAQITNPNNPLYVVTCRVERACVSPTSLPADQAESNLQLARNWLNTLASLADPAHAGDYEHALSDFDQKLTAAAQSIAALPAGPNRDRLSSKLAQLQADARQTLQGLLLRLALPEQLATTNELGRLGAAVPHLTSVTITLPAHPNGQATVSLSGDDLQPGATLLVDGRPVTATGMPQQGAYVFLANWNGKQHPHTVGLLNPDGTVAETTAITVKSPVGNGNGNGNGGGTGNGGGNGNGGGSGHTNSGNRNGTS